LSHGDHFSPQALNWKCNACRNPSSAVTTIGPVSRIQESSMGSPTTSTSSPHCRAASSASAGAATIVIGSRFAIARAISAYTARAPSSPASPQSPTSAMASVGHAMSVRSCRSVSAGMREPGGGTTVAS